MLEDEARGASRDFCAAEVEASYAACRRLGRRAGSNFPGGFLPPAGRRAPGDGRPLCLHAPQRRPGRRPAGRRPSPAGGAWPSGAADLGDGPAGRCPAVADGLRLAASGRRCCRRWPTPCGASTFRRSTSAPCSTAWRWTSTGRATRPSRSWRLLRAGGLGGRPGVHSRLGVPRPGGPGPGPRRRHRPATDQHPPRPEGRRRGRAASICRWTICGSAATRSSNCSGASPARRSAG